MRAIRVESRSGLELDPTDNRPEQESVIGVYRNSFTSQLELVYTIFGSGFESGHFTTGRRVIVVTVSQRRAGVDVAV